MTLELVKTELPKVHNPDFRQHPAFLEIGTLTARADELAVKIDDRKSDLQSIQERIDLLERQKAIAREDITRLTRTRGEVLRAATALDELSRDVDEQAAMPRKRKKAS